MTARRLIIPLALAPFLLAAQTPAASPVAAAKTPGPHVHEIVCKKFPPPVGTRLRERKICKTNAEWEMIKQDTFQVLDQVQRKPFQAP